MILTIDQGTTGSTCYIIAADGSVLSRAYSEFTQIYPKPGWVEHNAEEIWQVTLATIKQAITDANIDANNIQSIGITNQRETTVMWDKTTGKPVHNAIVWQSRQSAEICQRLQSLNSQVTAKTGLRLDPYFSATKIIWLLENVDNLKSACDTGNILFGTIDTWLIWQLTGGKTHATDHTNASRTMLYNIHQQAWDNELLTTFDIPSNILPQIKNSADDYGFTQEGIVADQAIAIHGVAGDQQAALFGQGCIEAGQVKNTYGTGCFMLMHTGDKPVHSDNGLLTTIACDQNGKPQYALEGSVFMAGAAVQWLRDEMQLVEKASQTQAIAESITDTQGVYLVPAFTGLGAPHWDANARGTIVGLTRGSGRKQIIRATLEAIAYQSYDVLTQMVTESNVPISHLKVDGGACANDFLMQFQADILNVTIERPKNVDSTALGAAMLAGIGSGLWQADALPSQLIELETRFEPQMNETERQQNCQGWQKAIEKTKA